MNRNTNSRFALTPTVSIGRSTFKRASDLKTSFDVSQIVPFYIDEVLPGDTFNVKTSKVIRMPMFQTAPMDNLYLDTYYFFVPMRLCWNHAKEFFGENNEQAWIPETEYTIPQLTSPSGGWEIGTLADYFGVPTGVDNLSINALPFRAFGLIYDQWFKSTVVDDPVNVPVDDTTVAGSNGDNYITDIIKGGMPPLANKYFDLFTSCLPSPQRGADVLIPIGTESAEYQISGNAPVFGNGNVLGLYDGTRSQALNRVAYNDEHYLGGNGAIGSAVGSLNEGNYASTSVNKGIGVVTKEVAGDTPSKSGLVADLSSGVTITGGTEVSIGSINQLRLAFQLQKWYEKLAIGGDRYIEIIKAMFGVTSPDARLQRTEYLGGNRIPIMIHEVMQTSGTGTTPQGTSTGNSLTTDVHKDFTKSFTEHGYVIGVMVARYDHTYQQGLDRLWTRKDKFDFYWPVFANIGNQAVTNDRIYAQGSQAINEETGKPYDSEVFGYCEAFAEYRMKNSLITGQMRSSYAQSLDVWHFGDDYDALPSLSSDWLKEDKANVDRTLVVGSGSTANQLFADIYVENISTRPMPMYSVPGLIDHH